MYAEKVLDFFYFNSWKMGAKTKVLCFMFSFSVKGYTILNKSKMPQNVMPEMKKFDSQIKSFKILNHKTKCDCCSTMLCLEGWVGSLLLCQLAHLFAVRLISSLAGPLIISHTHTHTHIERQQAAPWDKQAAFPSIFQISFSPWAVIGTCLKEQRGLPYQ